MGRDRDHNAEDSFDWDLKQDDARRSGLEMHRLEGHASHSRGEGRRERGRSDGTDHRQSERLMQLHPNDLGDRDAGDVSPGTRHPASTAFEHKAELGWLSDWDDADLCRLPIYHGPSLVVGQVYFDLRDLSGGQFRAGADTPLDGTELLVAEHQAPEDLWDRLTGLSEGTDLRAA